MDTILLYAKDRFDAAEALTILCNDIKAVEEANHKLYFRRLMFNSFTISSGHTDEDGTRHLDGDKEVVIFPMEREEQLEKLKVGKNILELRNCNWIIGEGEKAVERRSHIINWLLGADWNS